MDQVMQDHGPAQWPILMQGVDAVAAWPRAQAARVRDLLRLARAWHARASSNDQIKEKHT